MRYRLWRFSTLVLGLVFVMSPAAAEELVLKDGKKISGNIVGFEDGMFRVETEFGFALIRKDSVTSVNFKAGGSKEDARERSDQRNPKTTQSAGAEKASAPEIRNAAANPAPLKPAATPATAAQNTALKPPVVTAPAPPPVSQPLDEPLPVSVRDHVNGNQYINDTFQFAMFKPPGWKIYEGVPKETGSGIVAIGTEDEQTLLIVDRQVWSGAPDLKNDRTEERLRQNYQEFQEFLEFSAQLDGYPVTRRAFKGVLDGVEWHGVSVHLARGNTVFGIIGLTSAETFQFQQAVLNKVINSFHFLTPAPPAVSSSQASAKP